jgi:hypothetical protein
MDVDYAVLNAAFLWFGSQRDDLNALTFKDSIFTERLQSTENYCPAQPFAAKVRHII